MFGFTAAPRIIGHTVSNIIRWCSFEGRDEGEVSIVSLRYTGISIIETIKKAGPPQNGPPEVSMAGTIPNILQPH